MIEILTTKEIALMRLAGEKAASTLSSVEKMIRAGITTAQIDEFVREDCASLGCLPAPLGYTGTDGSLPPFPGACCTSVNDVVCHGIPGPYVLRDGDIINVDVTHIYNGFHGDTSATFIVGNASSEALYLVETCQKALKNAISVVRPGARVGDIGAAIAETVSGTGLSIVTAFVGHGIGRRFHTQPNIPHLGVQGTGVRLKKGMCFTIEPMLNVGLPDVRILDDEWTALTTDGSLSAQFEHTLVVTDDGCEITTAR